MAKEEVTMLFGAKHALRQLEEDVLALNDVLRDAELRAFTDHAVRRWLADIKDLVYDADDIIDNSRTQAEKLAMFRRVALALHHRTGRSIRSVNERLERIRKRESGLKLIAAAAPRDRGSSSRIGIQRQTDSLLEPLIVGLGIENETSSLVGLLTSQLDSPRITIVAITGMSRCRMGKTTVAQKICNNRTIKGSFREPPPVWVCVSQRYTKNTSFAELQDRWQSFDYH